MVPVDPLDLGPSRAADKIDVWQVPVRLCAQVCADCFATSWVESRIFSQQDTTKLPVYCVVGDDPNLPRHQHSILNRSDLLE